ncbi:MAG: FG-GAP-like repeat-containing protein [Winogradskyella sp.]|nr:FG-GAP-like repeat-containing protein [Winogradskyella sp.]
MRKTEVISLLFSLVFMFIKGQEVNEMANWPNNQWSLSGSYNAAFLLENPTTVSGSSSFSFDDNLAGGNSVNNVAVESPIIDLSVANNAGETEITVAFAYVFNIWEAETLQVQYWNNLTNQWVNWGNSLSENSSFEVNFCEGAFLGYTSATLDISSFTTAQLQGFRYRILYNDNGSFGWGFCVNSVVISSLTPPACPNVSSVTISNVNSTSANVNWITGGTETSWEVAVQLITEGVPASGSSTTNTTFNLINLTPETNYTAYVRAKCNNEGFSNWETRNFTTGSDLSGYPVTFTPNPIGTTGIYDIGLVDLNGDFLDDAVSISGNRINIHYQLSTGGFNAVDIATSNADFIPSWSMAAGDFDRNGFNDLLYADVNGVTFMKSNNSGTGYVEISGSEDIFSQRSNFIDINSDGHLDAFVCHDIEANVYYINDGLGNLVYYQGESEGVVPNGLGLTPGGGNYGTVWIDYDNDRDMDLFIAKCRGGSATISTNELWRNDGNGTFINVADSNGWYSSNYPSIGHNNSSNLGDNVQTWSAAWADFDNDGDMDVYVGASSLENGDSKLMRNNGDGTFTNATAGSGVLDAQLGIENTPVDFDNDGYVDILSNGNVLFNNGDFTFSNFPNNMPPSGAIGDSNNDGFLDVFRNGTIYLNNTNLNNWIKINTIGTDSNINGIGARVEIMTPAGKQIRDVRSGEGFEFMSSLNTHFGIGTETSIANVTIYWPSGIVDFIPNPSINTTLTIVEGSALTIEDKTLSDVSIYPNPVDDFLTIETTANLIHKVATVFDLNGKRVLSQKLTTNTLEVAQLESGIYFLRLESEGKSIKRKFIKN